MRGAGRAEAARAVSLAVSIAILSVAPGCLRYDAWLGDPVGVDGPPADVDDGPAEPPPTPCLTVDPYVVDFGAVGDGGSASLDVELGNSCDTEVRVSRFTLSGDPGFTVSVADESWAVSNDTAISGVDLFEPLVVEPGGGTVAVTIGFEPSAGKGAHANLVLVSDDPAVGQGLAVKLRANTALPCVATFPKMVDFGSALVGADPDVVALTIKSCGSVPLDVFDVVVEGAPSFGVSLAGAPPLPWTLPAGGQATVELIFEPTEVASTDASNQVDRETATLRLATGAYEPEHSVSLLGFGVDQACPEAAIDPDLQTEVVPPVVLTLDGSPSQSKESAVAAWLWTVDGPPGVHAFPFLPSPAAIAPSFEAALAGDYLFRLMVWDDAGTPACAPAEWSVTAKPGPGLHVELVWETPSDLDPSDTGPDAGPDLDLHLLHPWAEGVGQDVDGDGEPDGWFDVPFDACWLNPEPDWGEHGDPKAGDDPVLARDDIDGTGPESIKLTHMEPDAVYTVGVHHWDAHGFGSSLATVRVWVDGELVWSSTPRTMIDGWIWTVATIDGATGAVSPAEPTLCEPCLRKATGAGVNAKP